MDSLLIFLPTSGLLLLVLFASILFSRWKKYLIEPRKIQLAAVGTTFFIHLVVSISFIASLNQGAATEPFRPNFVQAMRLYPHFVFFPVILGWPILLFQWLSSEIIWKLGRPTFIASAAAIAISGSLILTLKESKGESMMIFEFSKNVSQTVSPSLVESEIDTFKIVETSLSSDSVAVTSDEDQLTKNRKLMSYRETWRERNHWHSAARIFYLLAFFYILALMIYQLLTSVAYVLFDKPGNSQSDRKAFCYFMLLSFGIILVWIPCRIYYNLHTKTPIFGATPDATLGVNLQTLLPGLDLKSWGLTSSEILPGIAFLLFLTIFWVSAMLRQREARMRLHFVLIVVSALTGLLTSFAIFKPDLFACWIGLEAPMEDVPIRILGLVIAVFIGYWLIVSNGNSLNNKECQVSISFAWEYPPGGDATVPQVVADFEEELRKGGWTTYKIDHKDLLNGDPIDEYVSELSKSDRITAFIKGRYLYSDSCMLDELLGAWYRCNKESDEFRKKVIALIFDDSLEAWNSWEQVVESWRGELADLNLVPTKKARIEELIKEFPQMVESINSIKTPRGDSNIRKDRFQAILQRLPSHT